MADFTIDETVDITDVVCPMTFVKANERLPDDKHQSYKGNPTQ